jgi:dTDP-4-dehydrorhamnose reductase
MILITGVGGLLGTEVMKMCDGVGTYFKDNPNMKNTMEMNIVDKKNVIKVLSKVNPDCIIHCAALTDVDYCEKFRDEAYKVNVLGTKNIVDFCEENNTRLIFLSTDFVFDGVKGNYTEGDEPNPINYYGYTKLEAEKLVQRLENYVIVRTSVIYGANKKNYVLWVIDELRNRKTINIVYDQFNSPTLNTNLADALIKFAKNNLKGIYHCAGSERISRYDFAIKIANIFNLDKSLIKKVSSVELNQLAKRPRDSSLVIEKAEHDLKTERFVCNEVNI